MKKPVINVNSKGEKFVLFFGAGKNNGVCSNWYMSDFVVDGQTFCCVEQYMMYMKAKVFKDEETANKILKTTSPKEMKSLGRAVKNYCEGVWQANRFNVVKKAVTCKFEQNEELKNWIQMADVDYFVECSPYDAIWGIKIGVDNPDCLDTSKWRGQNLLGKCLKEAREEICKN